MLVVWGGWVDGVFNVHPRLSDELLSVFAFGGDIYKKGQETC